MELTNLINNQYVSDLSIGAGRGRSLLTSLITSMSLISVLGLEVGGAY